MGVSINRATWLGPEYATSLVVGTPKRLLQEAQGGLLRRVKQRLLPRPLGEVCGH